MISASGVTNQRTRISWNGWQPSSQRGRVGEGERGSSLDREGREGDTETRRDGEKEIGRHGDRERGSAAIGKQCMHDLPVGGAGAPPLSPSPPLPLCLWPGLSRSSIG